MTFEPAVPTIVRGPERIADETWLLIEAGGPDDNPLIALPRGFADLFGQPFAATRPGNRTREGTAP